MDMTEISHDLQGFCWDFIQQKSISPTSRVILSL